MIIWADSHALRSLDTMTSPAFRAPVGSIIGDMTIDWNLLVLGCAFPALFSIVEWALRSGVHGGDPAWAWLVLTALGYRLCAMLRTTILIDPPSID